jgi:hypothetical protein
MQILSFAFNGVAPALQLVHMGGEFLVGIGPTQCKPEMTKTTLGAFAEETGQAMLELTNGVYLDPDEPVCLYQWDSDTGSGWFLFTEQ